MFQIDRQLLINKFEAARRRRSAMAVEIASCVMLFIEESVPVIVGVTTSRSTARQNRERKQDRSHQVVTSPSRRLLRSGSRGKTPVITQNKRHSDPPLSERFVMHEADGLVDVFGPNDPAATTILLSVAQLTMVPQSSAPCAAS